MCLNLNCLSGNLPGVDQYCCFGISAAAKGGAFFIKMTTITHKGSALRYKAFRNCEIL
jgi:hypothetical protein